MFSVIKIISLFIVGQYIYINLNTFSIPDFVICAINLFVFFNIENMIN